MAMTTTYQSKRIVDVPGVDIVSANEPDDGSGQELPSAAALAYIGSLHRRFWNRRRELLAGTNRSAGNLTNADHTTNSSAPVRDDLIHCRSWDTVEASVLVDGSAVPGAVFDVAMAMHDVVDELRAGVSPIMLCLPATDCHVEARLWADLVNVAQDRLGVERGTVDMLDTTGRSLLD